MTRQPRPIAGLLTTKQWLRNAVATQLGLYNAALLLIGERKLASLTENREPRRALDAVWDLQGDGSSSFVNFVLEAGQWKFALKTVKLEVSADVIPAFGYKYAFQQPVDYLRIAAISLDEYMSLPVNEYQAEGLHWFLDHADVYLTYVSNSAPACGEGLANWPPHFTQYAETLLASRVCRRLTGDDQAWKDLIALAARYLTKAEAIDGMAGPTKFLPPGAWVQSRNHSTRRDNGSRSRLIG